MTLNEAEALVRLVLSDGEIPSEAEIWRVKKSGYSSGDFELIEDLPKQRALLVTIVSGF